MYHRTALFLCALMACAGITRLKAQATASAYYPTADSALMSSFTGFLELDGGELVIFDRLGYLNTSDHPERVLRFLELAPDGTPLLQKDHRLPPPNVQFECFDHLRLNDGSFMLCGWLDDAALTVHLSATGDLLAARRYVTGDHSIFRHIWQANDSMLVAVGERSVGTGSDALIVRLTMDGTVLAATTVKVDGTVTKSRAGTALSGGDHLLLGIAHSTPGVLLPAHPMCMRLDNEGNVLWSERLVVPSDYCLPQTAVELPSGDLLYAGTYEDSLEVWHLLVGRFGATGQPVWTRVHRFGSGSIAPLPRSMHLQDDGTIVLGILENAPGALVIDTAGHVLSSWESLSAAVACVIHPLADGRQLFLSSSLPATGGRCPRLEWLDDTLGSVCLRYSPTLFSDSITVMASGTGESSSTTVVVNDITASFTTLTIPVAHVVECASTQVNDAAPAPSLEVWPQPVVDLLHVRSVHSIEGYEVMDLLGHRLHCTNRPSTDSLLDIDVSSLAAGLYVVRVAQQGTWTARTFAKVR